MYNMGDTSYNYLYLSDTYTEQSTVFTNITTNPDWSRLVDWINGESGAQRPPLPLTQTDVDAAHAAGVASVTPEDGIGMVDVDAALAEGFAFGAASVTPEDGVSKADLDAAAAAAYTQGTQSVMPDDGVSQADLDAAVLEAGTQVYQREAAAYTAGMRHDKEWIQARNAYRIVNNNTFIMVSSKKLNSYSIEYKSSLDINTFSLDIEVENRGELSAYKELQPWPHESVLVIGEGGKWKEKFGSSNVQVDKPNLNTIVGTFEGSGLNDNPVLSASNGILLNFYYADGLTPVLSRNCNESMFLHIRSFVPIPDLLDFVIFPSI